MTKMEWWQLILLEHKEKDRQKERRAAQAVSNESGMREKRAESEFIAMPPFCCSVFFLLTQ